MFHRGKVSLFFKEKKEKVDFKYNEDGTIEKSNIIKEETDIKYNNEKESYKTNIEINSNNIMNNNIKFLTGFYLFNKDIKNQIIESNFNKREYEKGYLINEKLFKIYSKFYDYNNLKDILNNDNKIKLDIDKNKNLSNEENIEKISNELIKIIPKDLKEEYINRFNEFNELLKNNELYYTTLKRYNYMKFIFYDNCILVKENLIKLISIDDPEILKGINNQKYIF